jgi:hypothetical protein
LIAVLATQNITADLQEIAAFWHDRDYPAGSDAMLAELNLPAIPNLICHPRMGRNFFARQPQSIDDQIRVQKLAALLKTMAAELREYVITDYLLLYLLSGTTIHLLAIKPTSSWSLIFSNLGNLDQFDL